MSLPAPGLRAASRRTNMPSDPFFSIIIPTYNRREYLRTAVASVLQQTDPRYELIIVDDGSTDGTDQIMSTFSDERTRYLHQENHGVAHARNQGLKIARGPWIAFLDSDDRWLPKKLERISGLMRDHPTIQIFHTEERWYRGGQVLLQKKKHQKPTGWVYPRVLPICCMSISTAVIHRSVFDRVGLFDETLPACEDYDFWLRSTHQFEVKLLEEALTEKEGGRDDQLSLQWGFDRFRIQALQKMIDSKTLSKDDEHLTRQTLKDKCRIYIQGAQKRQKLEEVRRYQKLLNSYE
ncbi:MAG: glycosyltransferase [Candidatus Omnitrophica bacterium]|nr:glycosyltransferase [Candidatus Omnitrophota bacterium]